MLARNKLIALVHTGAKKIGLDSDLYRSWMKIRIGVESCKDATDAQLRQLVDELVRDGHLQPPPKRPSRVPSAGVGEADRPTPRQWAKLWALALSRGWEGVEDGRCVAFCKRTTKVTHPRFLTRRGISNVITALEKMPRP